MSETGAIFLMIGFFLLISFISHLFIKHGDQSPKKMNNLFDDVSQIALSKFINNYPINNAYTKILKEGLFNIIRALCICPDNNEDDNTIYDTYNNLRFIDNFSGEGYLSYYKLNTETLADISIELMKIVLYYNKINPVFQSTFKLNNNKVSELLLPIVKQSTIFDNIVSLPEIKYNSTQQKVIKNFLAKMKISAGKISNIISSLEDSVSKFDEQCAWNLIVSFLIENSFINIKSIQYSELKFI